MRSTSENKRLANKKNLDSDEKKLLDNNNDDDE